MQLSLWSLNLIDRINNNNDVFVITVPDCLPGVTSSASRTPRRPRRNSRADNIRSTRCCSRGKSLRCQGFLGFRTETKKMAICIVHTAL